MPFEKKPGFHDIQKQREEIVFTSSTAQNDKKFTWGSITRHIIKTRCKCNCYEILQEEIKSAQKSIAHCKEDTNKILGKVERLERYFQ